MKMSRKQVKEALEQVPIETVLLGVTQAKTTKLTAKQREFARQLALGETKAGAYRKSRDSKAKPVTASRRGQELAKNSAIQAQVEAFRVALEAQRLATPAHLRALVIQQLTQHVISDDNSTREKLTALKLLGSVSEIGAFVERKEIIQTKAPAEIRTQLLDSIREAIKAEALTVEDTSGDDLLAELAQAAAADAAESGTIDTEAGPGADENIDSEQPPGGHPPNASNFSTQPLLSNPHNQSSQDFALASPTKGQPDDVTTSTDMSL